MFPVPTVHCRLPFYIELSSYVQWNCLARLSLSNMVLNMNLIMTQSTENVCVSEGCGD